MRIGNVDIAGRALLAPMAGVTDSPFRRICMEMGAALTYTEMVSAKGLFYAPERTAELLGGGDGLHPAAMQLFGTEPALMADMAAQYGAGYDIIDINMGCPVQKVVKAGQGCALMNRPALAGLIVREVVRRTGKPVTVKFRKGWDDEATAVEFAREMERCGAAAVAVHGRTRRQFYSGRADWDIIAEVRRAVGIPVIGSGDIFTAGDAEAMLARTGCDAVMVARGAQGNPWLFGQINDRLAGRPERHPDIGERLAVALRHGEALCALRGERVAVQQMRKHLGWYVKGIPGAADWRSRINGIATLAEMRILLLAIGKAN